MFKPIFKTVIFLTLYSSVCFAQMAEAQDFEIKKLSNVNLEEGLKYYLQYADNNHLLFVEYYTREVFVYDLNKQEVVYSTIISKGKGPFELTTLTGAVIIDGHIYLSSMKEPKLIQIDITNDEMKELRLENLLVRDLSTYKGDIIIKNNDLTNLFAEYDLDGNTESFINFKDFDSLREFSNFFYKEGDFSVHGNKLLFTTTYLPFIYVFDLDTKELIEKIKFDISDVEQPRKIDMGNGDVATLPPESNFKTREIAGVPAHTHKVVIVTEGTGENKKYSYFGLYEYDLKDKKFTKHYPFHLEIRSLVSNDKHIFFNSYDEPSIYRLTIKN